MMHYDGHGHRIDRIVRPEESHILEREIFGLGLFSERTDRWERLAKLLVIHQNGEHSVTCALACTEGLVALCDAFVETASDPVKRVWHHCKEGVDGQFGTASQFLTEIQGGSDVPANRVEAEPDGDAFRLYGTKFFCSACHTDYALVTAKVTGQESVTTFIVPSWLTPEDRAAERRNGYRINRIKRKLGTIELPTAEIEYEGAVAWPVGPIGKGLANVVGYVLTTSRIAVSIGNVASMLRATREAALYGDFREVFGRAVGHYPLGAAVIEDMRDRSRESLAGLFAVQAELLALGGRLTAGLPRDEDMDLRRRKFRLRLLLMMQKITTTRDCIDVIHQAISVFAGHGVMEGFSDLPRLLRDAYINEQWEGPRNLLLAQIYHDLRRVADWYPVDECLADLGPDADAALLRELADIVRLDGLETEPDADARQRARGWDRGWQELMQQWQRRSLSVID